MILGRAGLFASPAFVDLRFSSVAQQLREPTAFGETSLGGRHKVGFLHLTEVLKILFTRPLANRFQDLLLFNPSEIAFAGRRPPVRHIEAQGDRQVVGGDKARFGACIVVEPDRVNRLADAKGQKFNHNRLVLIEQPLPKLLGLSRDPFQPLRMDL